MNIWRVNTRTQSLQIQSVPEGWERLGGRSLIAAVLLGDVPPTCDPLGPHNRLIFSVGLLVGHSLSSCDRLSIGAKSPLTGGVKESNAGGTSGTALAMLGIRALILEDQPAGSDWHVLHVSSSGVRFDPAGDIAGQGVNASARALIERYGDRAAIALIGPAGEMQLLTAGIQNLDKDHIPSRFNARGGLGAVMGSKHIKAVVIDPTACQRPSLAHPEAFRAAQKEYTESLLAQPTTPVYRDFGTAAIGSLSNTYGALPTRAFSAGQYEQYEALSGETLRETILARGGTGDPSHACMPGCVIRCSNAYTQENGAPLVSPLEYETIGLMGSNLGMTSLDDVARLNRAANDLGVDTIDLGAALGVAIQAGLMNFGDASRALELIEEIRQGTPFGRLLGSGAGLTGRVLGVTRVPVVKNQAISAYDPRAIKGTGVTYATSPQGADHTAGLTIRARVDHTSPAGQVELSRKAQINMAGYDSLGVCTFAGFGFAAAPHTLSALLNTCYDWQVSSDILTELGKACLSMEREFNRRAGFTPADDRLPEWMAREALPPTGAVFDVPADELDGVFNW